MKKTVQSVTFCFVFIFSVIFSAGTVRAADAGVHGYNYVVKTVELECENVDWTRTVTNNTNKKQEVHCKTLRKKIFKGNLSGETEAKAVIEKMKYKPEVSFGQTKAEKLELTFGGAHKGRTKYTVGSYAVKTTGVMEYWNYGKLIRTREVSVMYTYVEFSLIEDANK